MSKIKFVNLHDSIKARAHVKSIHASDFDVRYEISLFDTSDGGLGDNDVNWMMNMLFEDHPEVLERLRNLLATIPAEMVKAVIQPFTEYELPLTLNLMHKSMYDFYHEDDCANTINELLEEDLGEYNDKINQWIDILQLSLNRYILSDIIKDIGMNKNKKSNIGVSPYGVLWYINNEDYKALGTTPVHVTNLNMLHTPFERLE